MRRPVDKYLKIARTFVTIGEPCSVPELHIDWKGVADWLFANSTSADMFLGDPAYRPAVAGARDLARFMMEHVDGGRP